MQLPSLFVKEAAEATVAASSEAAGARAAKLVAARAELVREEIQRLPEAAVWWWGGGGRRGLPDGGGPDGTSRSPSRKRRGWWTGIPTSPSYVWVGGERAKWPNVAEGETVATCLCLFGMSDPPTPTQNYFLLTLCFADEALGEYAGREVWQKLHRGGGMHHEEGGGTPPPQTVRDATALWAQLYAPKGGRPTKRGHEVVMVESEDGPPPPTTKGTAPTPSPKPSKVPKVASQPPPPQALDVGALAATLANHVKDTCQTLVEQTAVTGVEAALAKGTAAEQRPALWRAQKVQGNTHRALDRALEMANKRGEELEVVRGDLKEAQEASQKAEVEAAQLRVEVEALQRTSDDLQQRLGVAEVQVRSLTSILRATYTAQHGEGPPWVQSQGSGRSGSQCLVDLLKGLPEGIFRGEER